MDATRRWYTEPESFVAVAALIVSLSALGVGVYEAKLQRAHDRADVWPHLELEAFVEGDAGAKVQLENTGLGPAVVESIAVTADGQPLRDWPAALQALTGDSARAYSNTTVYQHGIRPGDHITLLGMPPASMPTPFWKQIRRIVATICYRSVFDEIWQLTDTLGAANHWSRPNACPAQPATTDF